VASLVRAAFPKYVDVAVEDAGLTLFQPVEPDAASEEVLLASRLRTRLFVTIAAAAGGGGSSATSEEVVRANSAINAASRLPPRDTLLYSVANI
jgi:anti-sigma factor RsiW